MAAWSNRRLHLQPGGTPLALGFSFVEANMGLMDILNGMQNGPRGAAGRSGGGGMSPLTMALLGLLAYKAVKSFSANSAPSATSGAPAGTPAPAGGAAGGVPGGGLGAGLDDLLRGGGAGAGSAGLGGLLGGLLGGAGAGGLGGLLTGGLGDLLDQFHGAGKGEVARSWVGGGQNHPISANDLAQVLTPDQIDFLTQHSGMSRDALLSGFSQQLPGLVDQLTPAGRLPTEDEMNRTV
jgi:uncharacterized protein YidB (DUF937 family)